ncbi:MAG: hypothetical protein ABIP97_12815 [Chthoniobacterales bacterium]
MSEFDPDFEGAWDEYEWERFLRQQDQNTEKYLGLLDKYMDHPERDQIIAREMGWSDWASTLPDSLEEEVERYLDEDADEEEDDSSFETFAQTPLYQETLKLHDYISKLFKKNPAFEDNTDALLLATSSAVCGAKLAAALCDEDSVELGMTIAYLKRGLKAVHDAMESGHRLVAKNLITRRQLGTLLRRIFRIRNAIIELMGQYRAEWRKRHGSGDQA